MGNHFIRHFPAENPAIWYVIVARDTDDEEHLEVLDAFPTRDLALVEKYRQGEQEHGIRKEQSRLVH